MTLKEKLLGEKPDLRSCIRVTEAELEKHFTTSQIIFERWYSELERRIDEMECSAVRVYGDSKESYCWDEKRFPGKEYRDSALLICVEPLDQAVPLSEVLDALEAARKTHPELRDLADRLKAHGVKGMK